MFEHIDASFHAMEKGNLNAQDFMTIAIQFDGKGPWQPMKTLRGNRKDSSWIKYDATAKKVSEPDTPSVFFS